MRIKVAICAVLGLFLLAGGWAYGQDVRASLGGIVTDPKGAVVANATVAVTADATGVVETTETNSAGEWLVSTLLAGFYHFEVKAPGFKNEKHSSIELQLGDKMLIDMKLQVGSATESVTVEATTPLIDMSAASGTTLTQVDLEEFPSQNNAPTMQEAVLPGTIVSGGVGGGVFLWSNSGLSDTTVNGVGNTGGAGNASISYTLDGGADNNNSAGSLAFEPPTDATGEVKVVSNGYDASIGRGLSASMEVSLKSGARNFHGDLYFDNQERTFNANSYQNDQTNAIGRAANPNYVLTQITPIHVNFWGGSVGGPVWIPKLYDGRNKKTFFFFSYSGITNIQASDTGFATLPTAQERNGDFSSSFTVVSGKPYPIQIFNPGSVTSGARKPYSFAGCVTGSASNPGIVNLPAGNTYTGTCESLPAVDAIAANYLKLIPPPGSPGYVAPDTAVSDNANDWIKQGVQNDKFHGFTLRVDQTENNKNHTFVDLYYNVFTELSDTDFGVGQYLPLQGQGQYRANKGITIDHDIQLKENLLLDLSYHVMYWNSQLWDSGRASTAESIGFPASFGAQMQYDVIPEISDSNIFQNLAISPGTDNAGQIAPLDLNQDINVRLSQTWKNHNFRYGMEYMIQQEDNHTKGDTGGDFIFGDNYTSQYGTGAGTNGNGIGDAYADFDLGLPGSTSSIPTNTSEFFSQHYVAFYFQDDWRVNPKLTLNLGLRWDFERPTTERFNRFFSVYNPTVPQPIVTAASQPNYAALVTGAPSTNAGIALLQNYGVAPGAFQVMGGPEYAGVNGNSRYENNPRYRYWQPRIGFAYEMMKNTVIRGGLARFAQADFSSANVSQTGFSTSTPYCPTLCQNYYFTNPAAPQTWENPFPQGLQPITGSSLGIETNVGEPTLGSGPTYASPNLGRIYLDTATLVVQHQIKDYLIEVGGLFNDVHGLGEQNSGTNQDINEPSAAAWIAENTPVFGANWLPGATLPGNTQVANPFHNVQYIYASEAGATTIAASQLLRPNPSATDIYLKTGAGRDFYNALTTKVEKRFQNGFAIIQSFSYSKQIAEDDWYTNQAVAFKLEKRIDPNDTRYHYVIAPVYELPFGRGKQYLNHVSRALDEAVGGWTFSGTYTFLSGVPLILPTNSAFFTGKDPVIKRGKTITNWFDPTQFVPFPSSSTTLATLENTSYPNYPAWTGVTSMPGIQFVPTSSSGPQNGIYNDFATWNTYYPTTFGDVRQPYETNMVLGARKSFLIAEGVKFEFRMDAFNALNHPTFASADTSIGSYGAHFGTLASSTTPTQSNTARQIQFSGRLYF
jgi:hypothetical protein